MSCVQGYRRGIVAFPAVCIYIYDIYIWRGHSVETHPTQTLNPMKVVVLFGEVIRILHLSHFLSYCEVGEGTSSSYMRAALGDVFIYGITKFVTHRFHCRFSSASHQQNPKS